MKRSARLLCVVTAILTALSFLVFPAGADGISGIYASKISAAQGDIFYVYVNIPAMQAEADALSVMVDFDPNVFEVLDWDAHLNISDVLQFSNYDNTYGYFTVTTANTEDSIDLRRGLNFVAEMRVRSGAQLGRHYIKMTQYSLTSAVVDGDDLTNVTLWYPAITETAVEVTAGTETDIYPVYGGGISLTTYALYPGSDFSVQLEIPASRTAELGNILVEYDGSVFELLSWAPNIAGAHAYTGTSYFSLNAENTYSAIDLSAGTVLYASMRVRDNAQPGSYNFRLVNSSFTYYDNSKREYVELWKPQNTVAAANIYAGGSLVTNTPTNIVVIPETTTTTTTTASQVYIDPRTYDDEVEYSEAGEEDTTVPPELSRGAEEDIGEQEIDIDDHEANYEDVVDPDDFEDVTQINEYEDDDDDDDDSGNSAPAITQGSVSLDCSRLSGLSDSKVELTTKNSYFSGRSAVILSNTDYADTCAKEALRQLGMYDHLYYAFDISVFNYDANRYVQQLANGGYIQLLMPLPAEMLSAPSNIEVFHIADGRPVALDRDIVSEGGRVMVRFSTDSFSPYMIADTARTYSEQSGSIVELDDDNGIISGGNTVPHNGNLNPSTGVAAAIALPAAVTGCVVLARKTVRRRKRARSNIDEDESSIPDEPELPV